MTEQKALGAKTTRYAASLNRRPSLSKLLPERLPDPRLALSEACRGAVGRRSPGRALTGH
jgi:hypothetical protein